MTLDAIYQYYLSCQSISTDTRNIGENSMFFALKGSHFNGNAFAAEALGKGAAYAIIDEPEFKTDERFILVDDVLKTLQDLARHHRQKLNIPVIGITGSNGKTTTKELFTVVLSQKYKVFSTKGNLNNHIGVPLTLLAIGKDTELAVVEMGANHQGEIRELASICQPNFGFITNIGKAHLEGFGGIEGVKKGKGELYDYIFKAGGTIFINSRDLTLMKMITDRFDLFEKKPQLINFPAKGDSFTCEVLQADPFLKYQDEAGNVVQTQLAGVYNFNNVAAALCVAKFFGVPPEKANEAISSYIPENNRSQIKHKGTNTIFLDAYNANPSSMQASLENFSQIKVTGKKVVILGDMFELGEESETEHAKIGELLNRLSFDTVLLCGKQIQAALPPNPKAYYFLDKFSLHNWLIDNKFSESNILVKGSRGMSLESVVEYL
jgi:UDP-N-acetylmuramoyl-tripeptide--D-alanyl-D-alanine ligase